MTTWGDHQRVLELAPWWVNGTLDAVERERVEAHLVSCADCRREMALLRQLGELEAARPPAVAPHPARLRSLMKRVDSQNPRGEAGETAPRGRRPRPEPIPGLWFLVGAQSVMILILLGVVLVERLALTGSDSPAVYRTLTSDSSHESGASTGADSGEAVSVRVVFVPGLTEQELAALLSDLGATMTGGPSALGVYTLELGTLPGDAAETDGVAGSRRTDAPDGPDDLADRKVELLREDPRVRFISRAGQP